MTNIIYQSQNKFLLNEKNEIVYKSQCGSTLKFTKENNKYIIYLLSERSRYYCINNCGSKRCYCKDKDWSHGLWNGVLYYSSNYQKTSNIFYFLRENFEILCNFDREKLTKWIQKNIETFLNKYYEEKLILIKVYTLYLFYIGFFAEDLYTIIKNKFIKENNDLTNIKIKSKYNYDNPKYSLCKKTITIGNVKLCHDIIYNYYDNNNKIKSLFQISIEHYENRFVIYHFLLNSKNFLLNNINTKNILCYLDINMDLIKECRTKLINYFSINENISNKVREITINNENNMDLFYEKYNIDENIKDLLKKHGIENIYYDIEYIKDDIDNIIEDWYSIDVNLNY